MAFFVRKKAKSIAIIIVQDEWRDREDCVYHVRSKM